MGGNPIILGLRFLLELATWGAMGYWGWTQHQGLGRFAWGVGLPLLAMAVWGVFRVPNDPGSAPVAVPGTIRLGIELLEFGLGAALLAAAGKPTLGLAFAALVVLHYAASSDRVAWLLRR